MGSVRDGIGIGGPGGLLGWILRGIWNGEIEIGRETLCVIFSDRVSRWKRTGYLEKRLQCCNNEGWWCNCDWGLGIKFVTMSGRDRMWYYEIRRTDKVVSFMKATLMKLKSYVKIYLSRSANYSRR
jgi:hypothetical protein